VKEDTVANSGDVLARALALDDQGLEAFRTAVVSLDKTDDFLVLLKAAAPAARQSYYQRAGKRAAERDEQRVSAMPDVTPAQVAAAGKSLSALLEPACLDFYQAAILEYHGKFLAAAEKYEAAFKAGRVSREAYYSAAGCWARSGKPDDAFRNLDRVVVAGMLAGQDLEDDSDLASLRGDPRWTRLVATVEQKRAEALKALPETRSVLATVRLPAPMLAGSVSVEQALNSRRSVRRITPEPLSPAQVSQLLWAAYGITLPTPAGPGLLRGGLRTAPSAGALYPLELYVVAGNVTGLEPGVWHYRSEANELELIRKGDCREELHTAAAGQGIRNAPVVIGYSAIYERTTGKYGARGRNRYVCMDAGHSSENLCLQVVAIGLGTCAIGAFYDDEVRLCLGMTRSEVPLYLFPVGKPKQQTP
jgi:SagB-type dehydrogenase family enzyme